MSRLTRRERRQQQFQQVAKEPEQKTQAPKIVYYPPKTLGQRNLKHALDNNRFVVINGPAGSGKTLMAVQRCISLLMDNSVKRVVLARPAVEADEKIGYLPGNFKEKLDPYLRPLYDAIEDIVGDVSVIDRWLREGKLTIAPLGYLRGRTFKDSAIVLDESQNCTHSQLKMISTRIGSNSHMFITGDVNQSDIGTNSGFKPFFDRLTSVNIDNVATVRLSNKDVIRDKIVSDLLDKIFDENL